MCVAPCYRHNHLLSIKPLVLYLCFSGVNICTAVAVKLDGVGFVLKRMPIALVLVIPIDTTGINSTTTKYSHRPMYLLLL